jgi:hypothetical protein
MFSNTAASQPPSTQDWVRWLMELRQVASAPPRPDGQALSSELPLWVECHMSFTMDHPELKKLYPSTQGLVLSRGEQQCRMSPERRVF